MFSFYWAYAGAALSYGNLSPNLWAFQTVSRSRWTILIPYLSVDSNVFIISTALLSSSFWWQPPLWALAHDSSTSQLVILNIPFPWIIICFCWRDTCSDLRGIFDRSNCLLVDKNFLPSDVLLSTSKIFIIIICCACKNVYVCERVCMRVCVCYM